MTRLSGEAAAESGLPGFWEVLRTVSGLLGVAAAGLVVLTTSMLGEDRPPRAEQFAVQQPSVQPALPVGSRVIAVPEPFARREFVFYLVATDAQAGRADTFEQIRIQETWAAGSDTMDRTYEILFASRDEEMHSAGAAILDRVMEYGGAALIESLTYAPFREAATSLAYAPNREALGID